MRRIQTDDPEREVDKRLEQEPPRNYRREQRGPIREHDGTKAGTVRS